MDRRGPQVTEAQVEAFENSLGSRLPDDYRQFLLEVNGGRTARSHREFALGTLNRLFSLDDTGDESRDLATRADRARSALSASELLFIGHDDGSARILLVSAGEHYGEVWLMQPDERPPDSNPRVLWHDRRDMKQLAGSFAEFMQSLRPLTSRTT